ncbi:MAG: Stp1/IreP family PP2C-type Ser/Thr phosphatase [Bacteriovoracaceae bacterium]|nr:Stp1/IreP family PP2C-type Ser/Thr phosphatase [Bacteriovoracaceae bacterium]
MPLLCTGLTDVGKTRQTNQDSIYLNKSKRIFVIADGMGGHNGGDIASNLAAKHIPEYILKNFEENPINVSLESIKHANDIIKMESDKNPELDGMGTTVISFFFKGQTLYIANVGDSRGYLVNKNKIYLLSKDHSLIQEKINLGLYTRQEAFKDPRKNILVRAVGFEEDVQVDVFTYKVLKNDLFVICSDGLYNKINEKDIMHILQECIPDCETANESDLKKATNVLVSLANINGGQDNISVILILAR